MLKPEIQAEMQDVQDRLDLLLPKIGKHKIELIQQHIAKHWEKRFQGKRRMPKYGSLNKGFTEQEIVAFFRAIDNDKFRLLFEYQANLGLRIGEACQVNIKDINFETRELKIRTEKARTIDTLIIPFPLFKETIEFAQNNAELIQQAQGYLFFAEQSGKPTKNPYIAVDYARNRFRHYRELARVDEVYDVSDEVDGVRTPRKLHRLTTHSLRHYAITRFAKQTNGNLVLTSRFARHLEPNTTMTYINTDKSELYAEIDAISVRNINTLKNRLEL